MTKKDLIKVFTNEKGQHILMDKNGNIIEGLICTNVEQNVNDPATCKAEFFVELCTDEAHAKSKCNNLKHTISIDTSGIKKILEEFEARNKRR